MRLKDLKLSFMKNNVDESGLCWKSRPRKKRKKKERRRKKEEESKKNTSVGRRKRGCQEEKKQRTNNVFPCANAAGTHKLRMAVEKVKIQERLKTLCSL